MKIIDSIKSYFKKKKAAHVAANKNIYAPATNGAKEDIRVPIEKLWFKKGYANKQDRYEFYYKKSENEYYKLVDGKFQKVDELSNVKLCKCGVGYYSHMLGDFFSTWGCKQFDISNISPQRDVSMGRCYFKTTEYYYDEISKEIGKDIDAHECYVRVEDLVFTQNYLNNELVKTEEMLEQEKHIQEEINQKRQKKIDEFESIMEK